MPALAWIALVPLFVGREKSIRALEEVMKAERFILLATQKNATDDDPATEWIEYVPGEILGMMLLTWVNLSYYQYLMAGMRQAISDGRLRDFVLETKRDWAAGDPL